MTCNDTKNCFPIRLDEKGISIHGKSKILLASSLFYFRIPQERWEDRMLLLKAAGYNAIDVYFPWNFHETAPGVWDFSGQRDVGRFLSLAAEHELFVIARPGPYICSEWDGGALPAWLWPEKIPVRQDDPAFLRCIEEWYAHILPLIAPFQITCNGTVICMQIENELDFFDCKSPVTYMEKLLKKARSFGISVPLFYCCGQNDLLRGGGLTPGLHTAFNVYASADNPGLEERTLHLCQAAFQRKMPLLVTETNREHSFLKRLLSCGAKLISPYNQTAGSTLEWYNGITNWGPSDAPLSLLASDYDFHSMIGSAGEVTAEFYQARLLSGLLLSLGESIGKGRPAHPEHISLCASGVSCKGFLLQTDRGGLFSVSNLGGWPSMEFSHDGQRHLLEIPPLETRLLPVNLVLSRDGSAVLKDSSYEVAYIEEKEGAVTVGMYGEGSFSTRLAVSGELFFLEGTPGQEPKHYSVKGVTLVVGSPRQMALSHIPGLPDIFGSAESQITAESLTHTLLAPLRLPEGPELKGDVLPMELLGQYRGAGCYSFSLKEPSQLLFQNVADIFTIRKDGGLLETGFSSGGCLERELPGGCFDIFTEIWGHSNFDDVRCPSLHMGSLKGLSGIFQITGRINLSENWLFDLDEQPVSDWYFFRHSSFQTLSSIDSYNRASMPFRGVYDKWVDIPEAADSLFLHFTKADCIIYVYVNGHFEGKAAPGNPYMDLSAYAGSGRIELCLRILRRFYSDAVGDVLLLYGKKIKDCSYRTVPIEQITFPKEAREAFFPLELSPKEDILLKLPLAPTQHKDLKLFVEAQDVKLTFLHKGRVIGRLLSAEKGFPVMAGGDPHVVHLCREWLEEEPPLVWCQPLGAHPCIKRITLRRCTSLLTPE